MLSTFAISYPLLTGDMVKQGHSDYCAAHGHASWVEDDVDKGVCPRCGTVTRPFYVDAPTPAPTPVPATHAVGAQRAVAGVVTDTPTDAATVVMFGRNALCGPGVPGVYARTSRMGTPTPAQLTDAVIAADAERTDARAALRAAEHAAFGAYMGSGDWRSVDAADARVAASERAYLSATRAVNRALRRGI